MSQKNRKDIQGLRAIAVSAVFLFHLWPNIFSGGYVGVDIFFVISGYLITLHLLQKPPLSLRKLAEFWARRIRRLLPMANLVLLTTLLGGMLLLPSTQLPTLAKEVAASAVYGENWMLASSSTDYLASEDAKSPVQHYWSLSVEEQFYAVWPILIVGLIVLSRRYGLRQGAVIGLTSVFLVSLAWSIYWTQQNQASAYFVTTTRVWELALGGIVASLSLMQSRYGVAHRRLFAWLGICAVTASLFVLNEASSFPGYIALLPTVGTALIIFSSIDAVRWSPRRLLDSRFSQYLGDISYSVYLWHWPLIILGAAWVSSDELSLAQKLGIIILALMLSTISKRFVEDKGQTWPLLKNSLRNTYVFGFVTMLIVVSSGLSVLWWTAQQEATAKRKVETALTSGDECLGALSVSGNSCDPLTSDLLMTPAFAKSDKSNLYADDCWANRPFTRHKVCTYGNKQGDVKVALLGNSHAGHWQPALGAIADTDKFRLDTYLVSECYTVNTPLDFTPSRLSTTCQQWNQWALRQIASKRYDLVVISNRSFVPIKDVSEQDQLAAATSAYRPTIDAITRSGAKLLVLRDTPALGFNVPDCVAKHSPAYCSTPVDEALVTDPLYEAAKQHGNPSVSALDLSAILCPEGVCRSAIGGLIVYFDHGHLSKSFGITLTDAIKPNVDRLLGL